MAEVEATPAAVNEGNQVIEEGDQDDNGKNKKHQHTPIEELYDLSKPIKRVERPSKDNHEAELAVLSEEVEVMKVKRQEVQSKIDEVMDSNRTSAVSKERDALARLRSQKGALINEKKAIRARLDATRNQSERLFEGQKAAKQGVKFTNLEDIDAEIKKLQRRQETTSMSLSEEKRLIKEMDALQASKKLVAQLKSQEINLENVKEQRKLIAVEIAAKDKEIDAVQVEIDAQSNKIKSMSDKETDSRGKIQALLNERDEIRAKINEKLQEKDKARKIFREANNAWYDYQRAIRAQRKMQQEEERRQREEERLAILKKKEEEELKKVPYEEEMMLCDYLADYLSKTYLTDSSQAKVDNKKKDDVVEVKDDPFAGFKPINKKTDDVFLKMGSGKKPRNRQSKKEKKKVAGPFTLNLDTFEQFSLLQLTPPTSLDAVQGSVDELREKKKWFSEQPRGSVPTANDIRKANEAKSKKSNSQSSSSINNASSNSSSKGSAPISFSNDDFVPLSASQPAASSDAGLSWGKGIAPSAPPSGSQQPTPAEMMKAEAQDEIAGGEE